MLLYNIEYNLQCKIKSVTDPDKYFPFCLAFESKRYAYISILHLNRIFLLCTIISDKILSNMVYALY